MGSSALLVAGMVYAILLCSAFWISEAEHYKHILKVLWRRNAHRYTSSEANDLQEKNMLKSLWYLVWSASVVLSKNVEKLFISNHLLLTKRSVRYKPFYVRFNYAFLCDNSIYDYNIIFGYVVALHRVVPAVCACIPYFPHNSICLSFPSHIQCILLNMAMKFNVNMLQNADKIKDVSS